MEDDTPGSPRKKARTTTDLGSSIDAITRTAGATIMSPSSDAAFNEQLQKEAACGITEFVSTDSLGFTGILKKRYTDFLVNEILPSGQVVHLTNLKPSKDKKEKGQTAQPSSYITKAGGKGPSARPSSIKPVSHPNGNGAGGIDARAASHSAGDVKASLPGQAVAQKDREETDRVLNVTAEKEPLSQIASTFGGQEDLTENKPEPPKANSSTADSSDPLARHFRDLLPHERTTIDHASSVLKPQQPPTPEKSVRCRQQYQIRRTSQGWSGADIADGSEDNRPVAEQHPNEPPVAGPPGSDEDTQIVLEQKARYSPKASSQSQWQSYAASNREVGAAHQVVDEDKKTLLSYFSESVVEGIISLYHEVINSSRRRARDYDQVQSEVIDRQLRTQIHQDVRRIFFSRLETRTDDDGCIIISAMPAVSSYDGRPTGNQADHKNRKQNDRSTKRTPQGRSDWLELGGNYLHFTLYKENKDTMECISWLAKQLKTNPKSFQFAGTKDRRAVTSQRVSVYKVMINRMIEVGRTLRSAEVGDFQFQSDSLQLGELNGNEFTITLRDCQFKSSQFGIQKSPTDVAREALKKFSERGFLNYYGLQRFGTFSVSTDDVGVKILQGDFVGAVDAILQFNPDLLSNSEVREGAKDKTSEDDRARAKAINYFRTTRKSHQALEMLPRKYSAESAIIRHLGRNGSERDCQGALQAIPRNLRLMYVHAYQSLVWNMVASQRWARFGNAVVEGDLVLIQDHTENEVDEVAREKVDEDGEVIVEPSVDDRATNASDLFVRARHLSREEAQSSKYTIFDIVLPTPGFDILYPANEISKVYEDVMASDRGGGLNPHDMRRSWKEISLSGSYRKLLARPGPDYSCDVQFYDDDDKQFVETDLDRLKKAKEGKTPTDHHEQIPFARMDFSKSKTRDATQTEPTPLKSKNLTEYDEEVPFTRMDFSMSKAHDATLTKPTTVEVTEAKDEDEDTEPEGGVPLADATREPPSQQQQQQQQKQQEQQQNQKIAVIIKFQLGSSQYATMALREMMKAGGVKPYKPDFSGGR